MGLLDPVPPPYDPLAWSKLPLGERGRLACEAWALQGYGTPLAVHFVYLAKALLFAAGWLFFCSLSPSLGEVSEVGRWWLAPLAFQKAIVWSLLFEVAGLGCGSGPLTGRYVPPFGGLLHFLRPGTTKLPLFTGSPLSGGHLRGWVDVLLYAGLLAASLWMLLSDEITREQLTLVVVLLPVIAWRDRTIFLAARGEHYWVTLVVCAFSGDWIAGAKCVQLALWMWAGISKLNHHFPTVVCVMTSNGPFTPFEWLRRRMYRRYPHDLRPSRLATWLAHLGTALELGVPLVLGLAGGGEWLVVGMVLMLLLHGYITSNVPMGVPIEWNVTVVYGAFALFWAHPEVSFWALEPATAVFLGLVLIGLPAFGNRFPERLSFLLSMRYYAGNWAYSVWLFRGESYRKLDRVKKSSAWIHDQLARFYDRATAVGLVGKVLAFRMMHLHGRALPHLIPRAVDRFEDYEYVDGELVAGLVLGWNFGDGHLHSERLLSAVQTQCNFAEGELRCIFVESQALGRPTLSYRIHDAKLGQMARGELSIETLRRGQPWEAAG